MSHAFRLLLIETFSGVPPPDELERLGVQVAVLFDDPELGIVEFDDSRGSAIPQLAKRMFAAVECDSWMIPFLQRAIEPLG